MNDQEAFDRIAHSVMRAVVHGDDFNLSVASHATNTMAVFEIADSVAEVVEREDFTDWASAAAEMLVRHAKSMGVLDDAVDGDWWGHAVLAVMDQNRSIARTTRITDFSERWSIGGPAH